LPPQASTFARGVDTLHYAVIAVTLLGATLVFALALYFAVRHPRRGTGELTRRMDVSLPLEIAIIGGLELLFLAFWVVGVLQYQRMTSPPPGARPIYVTAKQWMWKFSYPDGRASLDVLTVPAGRVVELVMTSRDVIHSFYVPAFRVKEDVIPGRYITLWFEANTPGRFDLDCAEYCGVGHSRMLGAVRVLGDDDYERWLDGRLPPSREGEGEGESPRTADLVSLGREVAAQRACLSCHTVDGQAHVGPSWARLYGSSVRLAGGGTVIADEAYLTRSMMDPDHEIVAGFKAVMPTYRGVLREAEVAALVEYIKSLREPGPAPGVTLPRLLPDAARASPDAGPEPAR